MKNVEDILPLSPMQQSMLLRALSTGGQEALFQQFRFDVRGSLDGAALRAAWCRAAMNHSVLRTSFVWRGVKKPVQVVKKTSEVQVEVQAMDAASLAAGHGSFEDRVTAFLAADRARGFDLGTAPLTRIHAIQRTEREWTLIWSSHHLVLDRWSLRPLLDDVWSEYGRLVGGDSDAHHTGRKTRFRDYVAWIQAQDAGELGKFWRERLNGAVRSARSMTRRIQGREGGSTETLTLDGGQRGDVIRAARELRVTPSALLQAAWALTAAETTESVDVLFGLTVAGRAAPVPGIEGAVGSFIGNVPVRVQLDPSAPAGDAARALLAESQARTAFEYASPTDLHGMSGLPAGEALFDSLFVWLEASQDPRVAGLEVEAREAGAAASSHPLTISVLDRLGSMDVTLGLATGTALVGSLTLSDLASRLRRSLETFVEHSDAPLGERARLPEPDHARATLPGTPPPLEGDATDAPAVEPGGREPDDPLMMRALFYDECESLLGGDRALDRGAGFYELGGTSLLAAQLHARLEALTGRELPLLELFEAPTLEAMADELVRQEWPLLSGVLRQARDVPAHEVEPAPPLICFSSPEVNSLGYVTLSRHLDASQPVFLAQSRPAGTDAVFRMAVSDIPKLAADAVAAIVARFPEGPLRLFGMCDGALICYEAARQLEAAGRAPDFVGILNTYALGTLSWRYKLKRVTSRLEYYRTRLAEKWASDPPPPEDTSAKADDSGKPETGSKLGPSLSERLASINAEWFKLDTPAHLPTRPSYGGKVTLLRNTQQPYWKIRDAALGWGHHAKSVETINVQELREREQGRDSRAEQEVHLALLREPDIKWVARALEDAWKEDSA